MSGDGPSGAGSSGAGSSGSGNGGGSGGGTGGGNRPGGTGLRPPRPSGPAFPTGSAASAVSAVSRLPAQLYAARQRARERWRRLSITVTVALALLAGAVYAVVWHTSLLGLDSVRVVGERTVAAQRITAAADLSTGTPLASIDTGAVAARVERLPQIAAASVAVHWPHGVTITVIERKAAALIPNADGFDIVDLDGVVFGTSTPRIPGLPLIQVSGGSALRSEVVPGALAALRAMTPDVVARVVTVSASDPNAITLHLTGGALVNWGDGTDAGQKALDLGALLRLGKATRYDVSAPGAPAMN